MSRRCRPPTVGSPLLLVLCSGWKSCSRAAWIEYSSHHVAVVLREERSERAVCFALWAQRVNLISKKSMRGRVSPSSCLNKSGNVVWKRERGRSDRMTKRKLNRSSCCSVFVVNSRLPGWTCIKHPRTTFQSFPSTSDHLQHQRLLNILPVQTDRQQSEHRHDVDARGSR